MKNANAINLASLRRLGAVPVVVALLSTALVPNTPAQESQGTVSATNRPSPTVSETTTDAADTSEKTLQSNDHSAGVSAGVQEILKMADAGVSTEVIKTFIGQSPGTYDPTAADLIALKKHGVSDEVASALLDRRAAVKAQTLRIKSDVVAPRIVKRLSSGTYLDPDSYEFWYYHYAYPRALSYSYRTLAPYYGPRNGYRVWHAPYRYRFR